MKKCKILLCLLMVCTVLLNGCKKVEEEDKMVALNSLNSGDYRIAIPFSYSDTRETHVQFNRGGYDVDAVGEGLLRYSKDYFDPKKYYLQEGQILDRNTLQAGLVYGDKEGILGSKSVTNPYGLNPEDGMQIPINNTTTITAKAGSGGTIPVVDVFELNFITNLDVNADIKGVSLAIVLNPNVVDAKGKAHVISDEKLRVYGEEAGRNLVAYLKKQPQISAKTPIMVALFKAESIDRNLPGTFLSVGYGNGNLDRFVNVSESWMIIPSATAQNTDSTLVAQFNAVKDALHDFLPNNTDVIGKGFFVDNRIDTLEINVTMQTKTYTEKIGLTQYMVELISQFTNTDMEISVCIKTTNETFALIKREKGAKNCDIITY